MNGWVLPADLLRQAAVHTLGARDLADLELLLDGALAPLAGYPTQADLDSITRRAQLADGTPWPVALRLEVSASSVEALDPGNPLRRVLVLADAEGTAVAAIDAVAVWPTRDGWYGVGGPVRRIGERTRGSFQRLRLTPDEVRPSLPAGRVLGVFVDAPLHRPQLAQIASAARTIAGHVLAFVPVAGPGPDGLSAEALVRTVLAASDRLPPSHVVALPLARRSDEVVAALLRSRIAQAYGASHLLVAAHQLSGGGPRALLPRELAYDGRDGQWRSADDVPPRHRRVALTASEINSLLDQGVALPEWHTPPAVARELARARPPRRLRGLVVLFTGRSGAGKTSIARGLAADLAETGERSVTLIDGDVARRYLGAGGGSDENLARVGFVAAEAARHGGLVLCCQIAGQDRGRALARAQAEQAGAGFLLIHVSTPQPVCAARMRARDGAQEAPAGGPAGPESGYHEPRDADLVVDTTDVSIADAVRTVTAHLVAQGWLDRP